MLANVIILKLFSQNCKKYSKYTKFIDRLFQNYSLGSVKFIEKLNLITAYRFFKNITTIRLSFQNCISTIE